MFDKITRFLNLALIILCALQSVAYFIRLDFWNGCFFGCLALTFNEVRLLTNQVEALTQDVENTYDAIKKED